jgi:RNA polymerase sigma factor (sigma-70 family)
VTTVLEPEVESDPYLISLVRGGDTDAFGKLYERHVGAAQRLARVLARDPSDADDLVAETFVRVLSALRAGHGPDTAFRAYLLTTLRHTLYDRTRRDRRVEYTDDLTPYERPVPGDDPLLTRLEASYAARAFARLPERWRAVLWHTEVEGETPAEVAPLLGLTPNGVSALAYRARERLRQMYLQEHIAATGSPRCHWTGEHLGGYVRASLARRDRSKVEDHLAECAACRVLHRELTEENSGLRGVLAGLLLGSAAPGYLAESGAQAAGWLAGVLAALALAWHTVLGWFGDVAAWVVAAWAKVLALPRKLAERYGPGNVAAAGGLLAACLLGVTIFAGVLVRHDGPQRTDALPPLPAPAQVTTPMPPATAAPQLVPPTISYPPPELEPLEPSRPQSLQPAAIGTPAVAPETSEARLTAAETGVLPVTVRMTEASTKVDSLTLRVPLPTGITLAGADAGDGWTCSAKAQDVLCNHSAKVHNGRTVARIKLTVAANVTGYQGFEVTVKAGAHSSTATLRAPIAPAGLHVAYAAAGRVGYATAGDVLVTCQPRPDCLAKDNNAQAMLPWLPVAGEPAPPKGLPAGVAASGAKIALPKGANVRWAGLMLARTGGAGPQNVVLAGPGGKWYPAKNGDDLTELVRDEGGGDWWLAARVEDLPTGLGQYAGWSITVVYDDPAADAGELAVYAGPAQLRETQELSVRLGRGGKVDLGLVIWDGDLSLTGDTLVVADQPVGDPANVAAGHNATSVGDPRSPGLDLLHTKASVAAGTSAILRAGNDPILVGSLTVLTETGQPAGQPSQDG